MIVGYILLLPPLASVAILFIEMYTLGRPRLRLFEHLFGTIWTGVGSRSDGFTSALPLYFGLMAIAGAYLIKEK
jgi:hypothetical protein